MNSTTVNPMSSSEAAAFAPTWGSYVTGGDPGACMYGFSNGDGRPQDENHRSRCIKYMEANLERVKNDPSQFEDEEDEEAETADDVINDIERFLAWMRTCPTQDSNEMPANINRSNTFTNGNLCRITYGAVLDAIEKTDSNPFSMEIKCQVEWAAIAQCVNQGIDSHLEAITNAQDEFDNGSCEITPANLCVLLRRLSETDYKEDSRFEEQVERADLDEDATTADLLREAGDRIQSDILTCLGFDDCGNFVGREEMGLE